MRSLFGLGIVSSLVACGGGGSTTTPDAAVEDFGFLKPELSLKANMELEAGADGFSEERDLREMGIFDSLSILKLLAFLEERFQVQFESQDLDENHFLSIVTIARLVQSKVRA